MAASIILFKRSFFFDIKHWQIYLFRTVLGICMLFLILSACIESFSAGAIAPGLGMFASIASLNIFFITVLGISMFSSVITEEKEVNALNLLLMTGITPYALLFSKSSSKLIIGSLFLLVQVPFTFLAVTLGGISYSQIFAVYISLFAYTFLICYLSLFASVVCRTSFEAAFLAFMLFLAVLFIPWGFVEVTPIKCISYILSNSFNGQLTGNQFVTDIVLGGVFFLLSLCCFNYFSRKQSSSKVTDSILIGRSGKNALFKISRCWTNSVTWKDYYFFSGGTKGVIFRCVLVGLCTAILAGIQYFDAGIVKVQFIINALFVASMIFLILDLVGFSAKVFRREIDSKTLPVLMMLPFTPKKIFYMKATSHIPVLIPYFICLAFCGIMTEHNIYEYNVLCTMTGFLFIFILYLHLVMFFSLYFRYGAFAIALLALGIAVVFLFVPIMYVMMILAALIAFIDKGGFETFFPFAICLATGVISMLVYYVVQILTFNRLRQLAAEL